jgi:two-component system sensor histidine kinase DesK
MDVPDPAGRLARFAEAGVVLFVLVVPVAPLVNELTWPHPGPKWQMTVSTAVYLPLLLWLVWPAIHGRRASGDRWVLAGLIGLMAVSTVWIGWFWTQEYGSLALALLVVLPMRWAWPAVAAVAVGTIPVSWATGQPPDPSQVSYVLQAILGLAPYLLIRLVAAIRDLDAARAAVGADAIARERLRAEENLWRTVGADLAQIIALGERARAVGADRRTVDMQLRSMVETARSSLAGVRRLVAEYRRASVPEEIDAAAALLRAAGIQTIVHAPSTVLTASREEQLRAALRRAVREVLGAPDVRFCEITLVRRDGGVLIEVRADGAPLATAEVS